MTTREVYVPSVDVYETKDSVVLLADMPGVDDKSVDITLEKDTLTIKGSIATNGFKDHSVYCAEYGIGDYARAFTISDEVDRDHIAATVKNGLLHVTLPKIEKAKVKKIAISTMS
jgi:HSP20 family molecular chaperone IbpA